MSSSVWSVVVLTPSARRVTLKVNKHTTLLQVLEDVCAKVSNSGGGDKLDPAEWDLTHYNRVLDLSLALGSSGVANNGCVEMVAATRVRRDEEVKVGLQVPSGKRLVHSFPSSCTLWGVVEHWRGEVGSAGGGQEEVCVYMRRELAGRAELEGTTLRSLGLTHGQAMVRLLFREEGVRGVQANVSARISVPMKQENEPKQQQQQQQQIGGSSNKVGGGALEGGGGQQGRHQDEPMEMDDHHHQPGSSGGGGSGQNHQQQQQHQKEVVVPNKTTSNKPPVNSGGVPLPAAPPSSAGGRSGGVAKVVNAEQHSKPGELHVLGSRDCVLYHGDDVLVDSTGMNDDDDDFYRVTVDDVRKMYRDLKDQRERLESTPLQLSSSRELDRDACVLRLLHDHPETIVRVRFPDRFVLQGVFRTADTIDTVTEWVRTFLHNQIQPFHLFTTPPRCVLRGESRLVEEGLVGMAIVYYGEQEEDGSSSSGGGGNKKPLKVELYGSVSAPDAALKLGRDRVNKSRRIQQQQQQQSEIATTSSGGGGATGGGVVPEDEEDDESPSRRPVLQQQQQQQQHGQGGGSGSGGVPKWFKLK